MEFLPSGVWENSLIAVVKGQMMKKWITERKKYKTRTTHKMRRKGERTKKENQKTRPA